MRAKRFGGLLLVLAGSLALGAAAPEPAPGAASSAPRAVLFQASAPRAVLFQAQISADAPVEGCHSADSPFPSGFSMARDLIAQGGGSVSGPNLTGRITWSQVARRFSDHGYCRTLIAGFLETDDGAEIFFEASGYAVEASVNGSSTLLFAMAIRFEDPDPPHERLADTIFSLEGELTIGSGRGQYSVFLPARSPSVFSERKEQDE